MVRATPADARNPWRSKGGSGRAGESVLRGTVDHHVTAKRRGRLSRSLLLRGLGLPRSPDRISRNDQLYAAILLFPSGRVVRGDRLALAEPCRSHHIGRDALTDEIVANGTRSAFRELLIVTIGTHAV